MEHRVKAGATTILRNGDRVQIRAIRSDDKQRLLDAFDRLAPESRYRRFFSPVTSSAGVSSAT